MKLVMVQNFLKLLILFSMPITSCNFISDDRVYPEVDPATLPYIVKITKESYIVPASENSYIVIDLNNDGKSEFITTGLGPALSDNVSNYFTLHDYMADAIIEQCNFSGKIRVGFIDLEDDQVLEIFVSEYISGKLYGKIFNWRGDSLAAFHIVSNSLVSPDEWDVQAHPIGAMDVDSDGRNEVILAVSTGYAYQPRGLYAIDYRTGDLKWTYALGTAPEGGIIADVDGDGKEEIIPISGAPVNGEGKFINGTDDANTYLLIFSNSGELTIRNRLGGKFTGVHPFSRDLDKDGKNEILILKTSRSDDPEDGSLIAFWDADKEVLTKKSPVTNKLIPTTTFIDADNDGIEEFVTLRVDGVLELRNIENKVVVKTELGEPAVDTQSQLLTVDLNLDGTKEIVVSGQSALFVFSKNLELQAKFPSPPGDVQLIKYGLQPNRLLFKSETRLCELSLVSNQLSFFSAYRGELTGLAVGCSLSFLLVFYFMKNGILSKKNDSQNLNSGQIQRAVAWAAITQELAHGLKTPLASVMLAAERLQMQYKKDSVENDLGYDKYVDHIVHEVRRLRELTDGFLKLAQLEEPDKRHIDINAIIKHCLQQMKPAVPAQIHIELDLETALPPVHVDGNQFQIMINVLLENAMQAIQKEGKLHITTRLAQALPRLSVASNNDVIRVEISDTGGGIEADNLQKIFEPFYTRKKGGTGLGLTIARKIIEDHDGRIDVKSEVGIGTIFVIIIPVGNTDE
ncbi:MAG: hypothetical protein DWQ05_13460 [Calditrichaeota bacterium]|nr:MAG: hypothetical protein DWQ05_13460 [Calditrichota bacterium]